MKAFQILKSFHSPDEWLTSSELSRRAHFPDASGYRLIQTLERIGAVVRGPSGRYRLGMLLVSLSNNVAIHECLREASRRITRELAARFNLTVHIGRLEFGMVTYVDKVSTPNCFPVHTRIGAQHEAYCTGLGKVLLAALPEDQLESFVMDGDLIALTPYTVKDSKSLRTQLERTRNDGFAIDNRESQANMFCIAVPIRDFEGVTIAAMSATDSAECMTRQRQTDIRAALAAAAAAVSTKLFPFGISLSKQDDVYQNRVLADGLIADA
jgi:DNA-binding IclR family transcriptional regulator